MSASFCNRNAHAQAQNKKVDLIIVWFFYDHFTWLLCQHRRTCKNENAINLFPDLLAFRKYIVYGTFSVFSDFY